MKNHNTFSHRTDYCRNNSGIIIDMKKSAENMFILSILVTV